MPLLGGKIEVDKETGDVEDKRGLLRKLFEEGPANVMTGNVTPNTLKNIKERRTIDEAIVTTEKFIEEMEIPEESSIAKALMFTANKGSVKLSELKAATDHFKKKETEEEKRLFEVGKTKEELDTDGDGVISPGEFKKAKDEGDLSLLRKQKQVAADVTAQKEIDVAAKKEGRERKTARVKANLMILRSHENYQLMIAEQKKINPGFEEGRIGGIELYLSGAFGQNSRVKPFEGDLVTTAISLAKIAAPSAKVGPTFEKMMEKTLNNIFSTGAESKNQLLQSMTDAFENEMSANLEYFLTDEEMELPSVQQIKLLRKKSAQFKIDMGKIMDEITGEVKQASEQSGYKKYF